MRTVDYYNKLEEALAGLDATPNMLSAITMFLDQARNELISQERSRMDYNLGLGIAPSTEYNCACAREKSAEEKIRALIREEIATTESRAVDDGVLYDE